MRTDTRFEELDGSDLGRLHDVVYELTGYSLEERYIKSVYNSLPIFTKHEIAQWGIDTCVSDEIFGLFKKNNPPMNSDTLECVSELNPMWVIKKIEESDMGINDFMDLTKGTYNPKIFLDILKYSAEKDYDGILYDSSN